MINHKSLPASTNNDSGLFRKTWLRNICEITTSQFVILSHDESTNTFIDSLLNFSFSLDLIHSKLEVEDSRQLICGNNFRRLIFYQLAVLVQVFIIIIVIIWRLSISTSRFDDAILCDESCIIAGRRCKSLSKIVNLDVMAIEVVTECEVKSFSRDLTGIKFLFF